MLARTLTALGAVTVAAALLMAIASVWLVLADPVTVADAVTDRGNRAVVEALAQVIVEALERVVRWL